MRGPLFPIDDSGFELLSYAMTHHSDGMQEGDVIVQTCWDADRLDLPRFGITPQADRLCTAPAKRPEVIQWAIRRALGE